MKYTMIALVVAAVALTACSKSVKPEPADSGYPAGTQRFDTPGGRVSWAVPANVAGTQCVVLVSNTEIGGISCNWGK